MKQFAVCTLGCKVNQEEGAAIAASLTAEGFHEVPFSNKADIYIINTCTVTHVADSKSRQMIRKAHKQNQTALLVVTGCYAQTDTEAVKAIENVDIICGNEEKSQIVTLIKERLSDKCKEKSILVGDIMKAKTFCAMPNISVQKRARAYLKIEDGCDQFCNYCIVPYARGPIRSMPLQEVVRQAESLVDAGHAEIILSGIHVGAYGRENGTSLYALLVELLKIEGLLRIRLGSIEALQINEKFIDLMQNEPRICRHLHIPLQSGCDRTLLAMGRKYNTAQFSELCMHLRMFFPDIAITTDIMVGYPDEKDEDFNATCDFVKKMHFAQAHIFPYSKRKQTVAAGLPNQVSENIKTTRVAELTKITTECRHHFLQSFIGRELYILSETETIKDGEKYIFGHTDNFLPVYCKKADFQKNTIFRCRVISEINQVLIAVPIG